MENASKALLIVAAVLVVIILIAVGIKIFSTGSDTIGQSQTIGKKIGDNSKAAIQIMKDNGNASKIRSSYEEYLADGNGTFKETLNSNGIIVDSISGNDSTGYTIVVNGVKYFLSNTNGAVTVSIVNESGNNYITLSATEFNERVLRSTKGVGTYDFRRQNVLDVLNDIKSVCNDTNREIAISSSRIYGISNDYTSKNVDDLIAQITNYKGNYGFFPDCFFGYTLNSEGYITNVRFIPSEGPFIPKH